MDEEHIDELDEPRDWGPLKWILALMMILLLIMWAIPYWAVTVDPSPKDVEAFEFNLTDVPGNLESLYEAPRLEVTPTIRQTALRITSQACDPSQVCYAKALFYYVRDEINYISDPAYEYVQHPEETLLGAGDCEDKTILLHMLMKSIGIESRIVVIPGHAYLQIRLPEASSRYKDGNGWVNLDTTCSSCDFGELPPFNDEKRKSIID